MPTHYDVVIAGGGVVGCAAALALANLSSLKIAVVESHPPSASGTHPSFDARVIALAQSSLSHLGSWKFNHGAISGAPIQRIHVSDRKHSGQTVLDATDANVDMLGKVVRLEELGLSLYEALQSTDVDYFTPESISAVTNHADCIVLSTEAREIECKLLVIAEGADSNTRALAGIQCLTDDYQQTAIISNVSTQLAHENCAYERFTKHGPLAFLPMFTDDKKYAGTLMSVVWTCSNSQLAEIMSLSDEAFLRRLNGMFGNRLGRLTTTTARQSYPLMLKQSEFFVSHRCICIGNAAQSLHPIAGQGFNLAVRDVNDLVTALKDASDAGSFATTQQYRKAREKDKLAVVGATNLLVRGFSNHYLPFVIGRNKALSALNFVGPLKNKLTQFAMGQR
ncbi:FAD-dependent oxidoreductase [Glaciecola sp. SC05]|uniref:FAD-dependent oxidoreductase n=1 Tax=Glaciecola sp. SC05 TaxID=1987355 RepID=UPI00352860B3